MMVEYGMNKVTTTTAPRTVQEKGSEKIAFLVIIWTIFDDLELTSSSSNLKLFRALFQADVQSVQLNNNASSGTSRIRPRSANENADSESNQSTTSRAGNYFRGFWRANFQFSTVIW